MTRILFISHWYPRKNAPTDGIFVREHARCVARYHPVSVIAIQGVHEEPTPQIKIDLVEDNRIPTYYLSYSKSAVPRTTWIKRWLGVRNIIQSMLGRGLGPELIHGNIYSSADLAFALSRWLHIPAVLSEHASSYHSRLLNRWQILKIRFLLKRLALIMPVSQNLGECMQAMGIQACYQIVPNTVDTGIFYPRPKSNQNKTRQQQLLLVAGLNKGKNINMAMDAISLLKQKMELHLNIIGDGPERKSLEHYAEISGLSAHVTFWGVKNKAEIADRMRNSDMLILSSLWENQPVVCLEAMACGIPVITPDVGGISEVLPAFCGKLFPPGDITAMAENIHYVMENAEEYHTGRISAYAQSMFSYEVVGSRLNELYTQVLEAHSR